MGQEARVRRVKSDRAKIIATKVLGRSSDETVDTLKGSLHDMGITKCPQEKLELVVLEDYEHLVELVSESGLPWQAQVVEGPPVRYIKVRQLWLWPFFVAMLLVVVLGGEGQLWDIFPWK